MKCFILLWLFPAIVLSQNLVRNPHLESGGNCFRGPASFDTSVCSYWHAPYDFLWYINSCAVDPDYRPLSAYLGIQIPRSGQGYAGIWGVGIYPGNYDTVSRNNYRSYATGEISTPLLKDSFYCVSYYISLGDTCSIAIDRIGVYLSDKIVTSNTYNGKLPFTPQIVSPKGLFYTDKINWVRVQSLYKAKGGEKYLTIGNFNDSINTSELKLKPFYLYRYNNTMYYLDDVSVVPVSSNFAKVNIGSDTILCDTVGFNRTLSVPPQLYDSIHWSTGATADSINISHTGIYSIECFNGECRAVDTIRISYQPPYLLSSHRDTIICADRLPLKLTTHLGFSRYRWSTGDTVAAISINTSGIYTVIFQTLCGAYYDTIAVLVNPTPALPITADTTICGNDVINPLSAIGIGLRWYGSNSDTIPLTAAPVPVANGASIQTYYVSQNINNCLGPKAKITVTITTAPVINLGLDQTHCKDLKIRLGADPLPLTSYLWNTGDTLSAITIAATGLYSCVATNTCGSATSTASVTFIDCDSGCVYVPNAFTPNQDGVNDELMVFSRCPYLYFQLQIFNRWGEQIYLSNDLYEGWNGSYRGENQPAGVYVYNLYLSNEKGDTKQRKGSITLIR